LFKKLVIILETELECPLSEIPICRHSHQVQILIAYYFEISLSSVISHSQGTGSGFPTKFSYAFLDKYNSLVS